MENLYNCSITDIGMVFVSICMVFTTIWATKNNSKLYYYDVMIRNEMQIILEFRELYHNAESSINWYVYNILSPRCFNFHVQDDKIPTIKRADIITHYNKINQLNNFYNKYQYIFRKYNIETDISLLTCILHTAYHLPKSDIKSVLKNKQWEKNGDFEEYVIPQYIDVNETFNAQAYSLLYPFKFPQKWYEYFILCCPNKDEFIRKQNEKYYSKMINELNKHDYNKYKNEVIGRLINLKFKLDYLCMFPMKRIPDNLQIRQENTYNNLAE